ncbi:MAG TPA: right-handed parallel beta-helix repeat-containing protein, partial [Methylobacter sp.]
QVYAPTGVYYCTGGLLVPSGVHFYGDGPDATIIRNPAGALPGITQSGITVFATIGSIQSVGARVSDLCVDHATNGCTSNGISFVAASGARSADYTIERCKVLGYDSHQYLIWGLRVENAVIRDNIVIGGGAPGSTSQSEGIEIFGGSFVEITGNYVTGMSSDCVNLVEDSGTPDTALSDLNVHHNYLVGAGRGVNLSVISTGLGFIISDNIILNSYLSSNGQAILAGVSSGGTMNGVTISDNEIIGAENIGIYLTATGAASASGWKVSGNSITGMTGAFPIGINADGIGALICDNYIVAGYEGISINNAGTTSSVLGNKIIAGSAGIAVAQDGNSSANVIGNDLVYGGGGIVATAGCTGTAVGNNFQYVGTEVAAVNVPSSYSVRGNNLAYAPTILDPFGAGRNQINCLILPRAAASLPAASSVQMGTKEFVTDANATTFGTAVAGGGTNKVPVWSNQTNWLIG